MPARAMLSLRSSSIAVSLWTAWLLGAAAVPAAAASYGTPDWSAQIAKGERAILDGDFRKARKQMISTADEMTERIGPGKGGERLFGLMALHRALSEAGLGNEDEALWYYRVALAFNPLLAEYALDRFGAPGRFLLSATPSAGGSSAEAADGEADRPVSAMAIAGNVTAPELIHRPQPEFPRGAQYFGVTGALVVQVIISKDGRPTEPKVLVALPAAGLTWAALEALRQWRFKPARLDGEPVRVFYNLTVNYRLRK